MSEWTRFEKDMELQEGVYFCGYGTGPYVGVFDYAADRQEMKPLTDRVQIIEWRKAPKNPFDNSTEENAEDRLWRDYEVEKPVTSGKYMCRYLHNYRLGDLHYSPEDGWEGNFVVTHFMRV